MLYGGEGDDTFHWSTDTLIDGDTGSISSGSNITVAGIDLTVDLSNPNVETTVLGTRVIGVERLMVHAGSGNDRLTGGIGDDVLVGNAATTSSSAAPGTTICPAATATTS